MKAWVKTLLLLLVVQLMVLVALKLGGGSNERDEPAVFAVYDVDEVAKIAITDSEGATVSLTRLTDEWQLANGLPADEVKLNGMLAKISQLQVGWPISRSAAALERFEVAADKFQRRLEITAGEDVGVYYFGTSPGYQQTHARAAGDDVFAVKISNYELPTAAEEWLDKGLLRPVDPVTKVTYEASAVDDREVRRLVHAAQQWQVNGSAANTEAVTELLNNFGTLSVLDMMLSDSDAAATTEVIQSIQLVDGAGEWEFTLLNTKAIAQASGQASGQAIAQADARDAQKPNAQEDEEYFVSSSRYAGWQFRVSSTLFDLLNPALADLQAVPKPLTEPSADSGTQ